MSTETRPIGAPRVFRDDPVWPLPARPNNDFCPRVFSQAWDGSTGYRHYMIGTFVLPRMGMIQ